MVVLNLFVNESLTNDAKLQDTFNSTQLLSTVSLQNTSEFLETADEYNECFTFDVNYEVIPAIVCSFLLIFGLLLCLFGESRCRPVESVAR